jgi:hypothetical protein
MAIRCAEKCRQEEVIESPAKMVELEARELTIPSETPRHCCDEVFPGSSPAEVP